ncbi:MAG: hypothetical protein KC609_15405 [Myxococcales bacterium]|nr:hypothetical protein [Myxococcales bacterium]
MRRFTLLAVSLVAFCAACGNAPTLTGEEPGITVTLATQPLGTCNEQASIHGSNQFPPDSIKAKIRVFKEDDSVAREVTSTASDLLPTGELLIEQVPVGTDLRLQLVACDANGSVIWGGMTRGIALGEFKKVTTEIFLTRRGRFNCTGSNRIVQNIPIGQPKPPANLAFHSATTLDDGTVLLVGGIRMLDKGVNGLTTDRASLYHPNRGVFEPLKSTLTSSRAFHKAVPFIINDRQVVLLIGGTKTALFDPINSDAPWGSKEAPTVVLEAYDIATKSFVPVFGVDIPVRLHAAVATSADRKLLVVAGGLNESNKATDDLYVWSGDSLLKTKLLTKRVGAAVVRLANGNFLIYGGNVDGDPSHIAELFNPNNVTTELVPVQGTPAPVVTAFSAVLNKVDRLFVLGGHEVSATNKRVIQRTAAGLAYIIDYDQNSKKALMVPLTLDDTAKSLVERVYHTATWVGDQILVTGGHKGATFSSGTSLDTMVLLSFPNNDIAVTPLTDSSNTEVKFPSTVVGASAVALPDGTVLFVGGMVNLTQDQVFDIAHIWAFPISDPANCD